MPEGSVGHPVHHFGPDHFNMEVLYIHGSQWRNPTHFGDPLTFPLVPPSGWYLGFLVKFKFNPMTCFILFTHNSVLPHYGTVVWKTKSWGDVLGCEKGQMIWSVRAAVDSVFV